MSSTSLTTTPVIDTGDDITPFMLPGMAAPEHRILEAGTRIVRFDRQCVLIPECPKPKRSMVITRSYSLPLWKRRGRQPECDAVEESPGLPARSPSPEHSRVVIKVPIPTFRRRPSRSPPRGRSVSTSPTMHGLTPCLVHRDPSTSPEIPSKIPSRPSLPIYHRRQNDITIPLRECCQACERITEECIREGDHWTEKFSRGARRRRSVSLDQHELLVKMDCSPLHINPTNYANGMVIDDEALDMESVPRCGISLTVDEVDKRRKSLLDYSQFDCSPTSPSFHSHERDISSSSTSSLSHSDELMIPDILDSRRFLRASPIEEEDEAELFPLPRRTPSATPSPKISPSHSPSGSTFCLPSSVGLKLQAACSSSKESVASRDNSSSLESGLKASLTRKPPGGVGLGFPPAFQATGKGSPLAVNNITSSKYRPLPPLPPKPLPSINPSPPFASSTDNATFPEPADLHHPTNTSYSAPTHSAQSSDRMDASSSPLSSSPPSPSFHRRKASFTSPFVKAGGAIKGASVDVLKGVNSMSLGSAF